MKPRFPLTAAALAAATLPALAGAISTIVPAQPSSFDPVNLRMTVDSCTYVPATVRVTASGTVLRVTQQTNACLVAGTPVVVDVRLGTLAAGDYHVEVFASPATNGPPAESLRFTVAERPEAAVFPPITRPLTDYTGVWWTESESGWGLSIHQAPDHVVFGAGFVYGGNNQPLWFTLQGGQWTSATRWTGTLYLTTGPSFSSPDFDPRLVLIQAAGQATLDFTNAPANRGKALFTYNVNNIPVSKTITRMVF